MKTRRKKLQYNITKKKHKKFSRKKKTYKNKTQKGGNYIIIATALGISAAASGFGWRLYSKNSKKRLDSKKRLETVAEEIGVVDPVVDDLFLGEKETSGNPPALRFHPPPPPLRLPRLISFTIPHIVRKGRDPRLLRGLRHRDQITLTCENIKEQTKKIFETYYYTNEHFKKFTREIRQLNERIDNPNINSILLMHDDFLETDEYKKQIKSYETLGAYKSSSLGSATASGEIGGRQTTKYNNKQQILYKDAKNYYCLDNTYQIDKDFIINLRPFTRSRRGGSRVEPQPDKILDYLTIDGVAKDPSVKGKMEYVFGTLLSYFLPTGSSAAADTLIFDFYNENILLHDPNDFDIIKTFIDGTETSYKDNIRTKGTNARKKIELLNLISSNTICKFLMDYLVQELPPSYGITEDRETYELVSESIRINWRINNIYGENKQEKPPDGHNLYLKEGGPRYKYLIDPKFVGGATRVDKSPTRGTRVGFPKDLKEKAVLDRKKRDIQTRLRERDLARFIPFIKKKLDTLVSKKQIPYEVLLVLLGLILSDNEDIIEGEKILAVNIIYNEIIRYGSQNLYDVSMGAGRRVPKQHRDQAQLMLRPVTAIPKDLLMTFVSNKTIIPAFMAERDLITMNIALENYLMTNLKFGEFVEKYFTTLVHNCKGKTLEEILEIEKKALYSIFYFTLNGTDGQWMRQGETTIDNYNENLKILLPNVNFSMLQTPEDFHDQFAESYGATGSQFTSFILRIITSRSYKFL